MYKAAKSVGRLCQWVKSRARALKCFTLLATSLTLLWSCGGLNINRATYVESAADVDDLYGPLSQTNARAFIADFQTLQKRLEDQYPNLMWKGSVESGVDLPALADDSMAELKLAKTRYEAYRIIEDFLYHMYDDHVEVYRFGEAGAPLPVSELREVFADSRSACANLGYINRLRSG